MALRSVKRLVCGGSVLLAAMLPGAPVAAQAADPLTQAQALFDDLAAMRWQAAARRFHPAAAERMRRSAIAMARTLEAAGRHTPIYDPSMPEAVREWFEQQRREHEASGRADLHVVPLAELEEVDAFDALARILARADVRTQMLLELERRRDALPPGLRLDDEPGFTNLAVAAAYESDSVAYVIYHTYHGDAGRTPVQPPEVATLRRTADGWGVWSLSRHDGIGGTAFIFHSFADIDERLLELQDSVFSWPPDGPPEFTARIVGFTPGEPPRGVLLEAIQPDGTTRQLEIPHAALERLLGYLQPWLWVR